MNLHPICNICHSRTRSFNLHAASDSRTKLNAEHSEFGTPSACKDLDVPTITDRSVITTGPAADDKEALRKKPIGSPVNVKIEYTRPTSEESARKESILFATVDREGDKKHTYVALPMISNGILSVVRHGGEEDRANNYYEYLERQSEAMEAKRGMHGDPRSTTVELTI